MAMKILLFIALAVALCYGYAHNCLRGARDQKRFWVDQRRLIGCNSPQDTLVQLKVPKGFDYVKPSVVKIPQCSGLFCPNYPTKCVPLNSHTKSLVVEAFKKGEDDKPNCVKVYVEEHTECSCDCVQTECDHENQIFNDSTCECECDPRRKSHCEDKVTNGEQVQWSEKSCDCLCRRPEECDVSMDWNQGLCRCEYKSEEDSNEQDYN